MAKPLCVCIIDAFGKRDNPTCPSCHPAPPAETPDSMGFEMIDFNDDDVLELEDQEDAAAQIQEIFDEQEEDSGGCCGGGCPVCSPDT